MSDFFSSERKKKMLISLVGPSDVITVLTDLESHFSGKEEYEKCKNIESWIGQMVPYLTMM
jgi:hypothetical protein